MLLPRAFIIFLISYAFWPLCAMQKEQQPDWLYSGAHSQNAAVFMPQLSWRSTTGAFPLVFPAEQYTALPVQVVYEPYKYQTQTARVATTLDALSFPKPPPFKVITLEEKKNLFIQACQVGNEEALEELLQRIYWGANNNCFSKEDFLRINDIENKLKSSDSYIYWNVLIQLNIFDKFPTLSDYIKLKAEKKQATALYAYGKMFELGHGVGSAWVGGAQDLQQAAKWYELAASQGFAPAQNDLGVFHLMGLAGFAKNIAKAKNYFQKAADQGYLVAYYNLGLLLEDNVEKFRYIFISNQENTKMGRWCTNVLIPRTQKKNKYTWDSEKFFRDVFTVSSELFYCYNRDYILYPLANKATSDELEIFNKFFEAFETWKNAYISLISFLKNTEPGFLINNYDLRNAEILSRQNGEIFVKRYTLDDDLYISIGSENIKLADEVDKYVKLYQDVQKLLKKVERFCQKELGYINKKIYRKTKYQQGLQALSAGEIVAEDRPTLNFCMMQNAFKIQAYQIALPNYDAALHTIKGWFAGATVLHEQIINNYLKEGANFRNKKLVEAYSYLK